MKTGLLDQRLELPIEGMTCSSCAGRVEKSLNRLDGVEATVNFATERASVSFDPARVAPGELVGAVESVGYSATLPSAGDEGGESNEADPTEDLRRRLIFAAALSLPVLLLSMIEPLQFENWQWLSLQLAVPVVLWAGWPFHKAAWQNLRHGAATMDTLISLGTLAALGWSLVALFFGDAGMQGMKMPFELVSERGAGSDQIYLEVASVVTTFILAGRYFEARAKRRAGAALEALLDLGAKDVAVLDDDGNERRLPVEELAVGRRFVVRPGEKVATDGVVESGSSAVDRSLVTGESVPVEVGPGEEVIGATINVGGRLVVRATRVGEETALAQIARLVTEAQSGKAPVQRLADRISAVFVPIVIALAVGNARVLARQRRRCELRLHRRRRGADHRLPLRAGAGDADRAPRRDRPRRPARAPDQGAGGAGVDAGDRHRRPRQDRDCDQRRDGGGGGPRRPRGGRGRGAAPGRRRRGRLRAPDRAGDRGPRQGGVRAPPRGRRLRERGRGGGSWRRRRPRGRGRSPGDVDSCPASWATTARARRDGDRGRVGRRRPRPDRRRRRGQALERARRSRRCGSWSCGRSC